MEFEPMTQMNKAKRIIAMAGLLGGLVLAGAPAFAQTSAPSDATQQGGGMMENGMPKGQSGMPGMMMNSEMQQKMSRMMDDCNHMMESMRQNKDSAPTNGG
jgi:Spy/CpxP family protein refolding chaperone